MQKVTLGVVGLGGIARKAHLPVLAAHPAVEIVALCSRTGERVEGLASQYRLRLRARTFAELLALRPHAAYLLSPTDLHPEQAVALLEAGIAVYMEKPLANYLDGARRIAEAAAAPGRLLMVGFNRRYAPAYRRVRSLLAGRRPGLINIQKHRSSTSDWPVRQIIMDDTIHIIDLARFLTGELTVRASRVSPGLVAAQLEAPDGAVVQLSQCFTAGKQTERLEVHGDGISIIVEEMERLTVIEGGTLRREQVGGSWTSTLEKRGMAPATDHFLNCLATGAQPETTAAEALVTQELAEAILLAGG